MKKVFVLVMALGIMVSASVYANFGGSDSGNGYICPSVCENNCPTGGCYYK